MAAIFTQPGRFFASLTNSVIERIVLVLGGALHLIYPPALTEAD
jgi:hypothetical protein